MEQTGELVRETEGALLDHPREVLADCEDYLVEWHWSEVVGQCRVPFMHLSVASPTSPRVMRELKELWGRLQWDLPPIMFAAATVDDDRITRLARWFGFQYLSTAPCSDGKERRIFVHYRPTNKEK
jgi:hypothetical protein